MRSRFKSLIFILYLILCFVTVNLYSQSNSRDCYIRLRGIAEETMNPSREVSVKVYEGNKVVQEVLTDFDGKFMFELDTGKRYTIVVSKSGYLTKKLAYITNVPKDECAVWTNECAITMVKECGNVDLSILDKPIDEIKYHSRTGTFKSDPDYSRKMFKELDVIYYELSNCHYEKYNQLLDKAEQAYKEDRLSDAKELYREATEMMPSEDYARKKMYDVIAELQEKNKETDDFIKLKQNADNLFAQEKFKEALDIYNKAFEINNNDADLISKMNTARQKVHDELIANNQAKLEQQRNTAQKEQQFSALLTKADDLYKNSDFVNAKENYQKALAIKPEDTYTKSRLERIDQLINKQATENRLAEERQKEQQYRQLFNEGLSLQAQNNYELAKQKYQQALTFKPDDLAAKQKLQELNNLISVQQQRQIAQQEKERQYTQLIAEGNNLIISGDLDIAKQKFNQALMIKPGDAIAKNKISQIDQKIAEQNKLLAQREKDKKYNDLITQGNQMLSIGELTSAEAIFQQAALIKPGDAMASAKIRQIDQRIEQQKQSEIAEQQKQLAEQQKENQYKQLIAKASTLKQNNQLELAKAEYQKALAIKPNDPVSLSGIQQIDRQLQQQILAENQKKEKEAAYRNDIGNADNLLAMGELEQAKNLYQKALLSKPNDPYATSKISEVNNAILKNKQEEQAQLTRENQYNQFISKGSTLMQNGDLIAAKLEFQKALNIKPGDPVASARISEADRLIQQKNQQAMMAQQKEQQYNNLIQKADDFYTKKQLESALNYYQQALAIKPGEMHPTNRVNELNQTIADNKQNEQNKLDYENTLRIANNYFNKGDMSNAKLQYQKALSLNSGSTYAKQQLDKISRAQQLASNNSQSTNSGVTKSALAELKFSSNIDRDRYLTQLTRKYPSGITLEVYKEEFKTTYRYIVIRDGKANEYREIRHSYGGVDYSLNDKSTNSMYFKQQTKQKDGEYYKKFDM